MELLFPTILSYILEYKYIGLFIFSVLASAGIPLPLDLSVVAIGALVSQGVFGFTETLLVFILGNVLGDSFDYFAARLVEQKAIHESYLKKYSFFYLDEWTL